MTEAPAQTPALFDPVHIGRIECRNRLWLAPMTNQQSHEDGTLSDDELRWLEARAAGGFGVIESCATHVSPEGRGWPGALGCDSDRTLDGWARLAAMCHAHGATLVPQLFHGGARAVPSAARWAPDASDGTRAGTDDDINGVIDAFARAAARVASAGVDGIELHGAHGYLLSQFLARSTNTRVDTWGVDLEGRARLLRSVLAACRAATPAGFTIGVRLSPEWWGTAAPTGPPPLDLDESVQVAKWLADDGVDFIHLSLWDASLPARAKPTEHPIPLFRAALPDRVSLIAAGNLWTVADCEAAIARGADAVALGRCAIANPAWPTDAQRPGFAPRRPPLTLDELAERALSPAFAAYMRRWPGFVADEPA
ncbi:MAG: NADH:flavin oxidoreductase [Myxococcales bacterium]|nr:NADH:flavin oxidoreductase [Myxococcales bacterium]MCB9534398.1 NADH:flavin oxidoreductase [Myxococcales bacterium]